LEACTTPGTPPEEKEKRDKTTITSVTSIKSLGEECVRLCEESTWIWTQLMVNLELKEIEERVRSVHREGTESQ
jgi:hypothetical protein